MERDIFEKLANEYEWSADDCVEILMQYVERQQSPEAFAAFVQECADNERTAD